MVDLAIHGDQLQLNVRGLDRLWAMRSRLDIPLASVRSARADRTVARGIWKGVSAPGTHIPGLIIAGTFYQDDKRIFWDVHHGEKALVIELVGQRYDLLIVEVADPEAAAKMIADAIQQAGGGGDQVSGNDSPRSASGPNG